MNKEPKMYWENEIVRTFATNLRYAMEKIGYTQDDVAEQARCHQSYVSDIVNGKRVLRLDTAEKFAKVFGLELWQTLLPRREFIKEFVERMHRDD